MRAALFFSSLSCSGSSSPLSACSPLFLPHLWAGGVDRPGRHAPACKQGGGGRAPAGPGQAGPAPASRRGRAGGNAARRLRACGRRRRRRGGDAGGGPAGAGRDGGQHGERRAEGRAWWRLLPSGRERGARRELGTQRASGMQVRGARGRCCCSLHSLFFFVRSGETRAHAPHTHTHTHRPVRVERTVDPPPLPHSPLHLNEAPPRLRPGRGRGRADRAGRLWRAPPPPPGLGGWGGPGQGAPGPGGRGGGDQEGRPGGGESEAGCGGGRGGRAEGQRMRGG